MWNVSLKVAPDNLALNSCLPLCFNLFHLKSETIAVPKKHIFNKTQEISY